ncbi:MAG: hypothetical protein A2Y12_08830 [Planctomycetes bacterium GWF2_42_9]|nr:MAG: hypothetical protein A2Y12_08830 [Planctomycetes bacterium GWF2_42_9]HAL45502.1 hypothetical protein [Phycisphaerales bacterium]
MLNGYPAVTDIETLLAAEGVEELGDNNSNFRTEWMQFLYRLLMRTKFAAALNVYCPSSTTFNIVGGTYNYKGAVKTYAPGSAVDPTDNDTTYIWLNPDNTIGSGIDGSGWPATEHFKLASIVVDSSGVITAINDLRGYELLKFAPSVVLLSSTSVNLNAAADTETVLYTVPTGKKLIVEKVVIRGLSASAALAVITLGKGGGACDEFLGNQTLSNLNGATKAAILQAIPNATPVAQTILAATETFSSEITTAAGSACTAIFDLFGILIDA